jgi:3-hydroxyacyl-[acyl-carrier-protein] dehydratase
MDEHFRAFSFVDRIISVQDGKRIRGRYAMPSELNDFPLALVGEAVGQLAAWAAMAAVGFDQRPVAGLAGCIELVSAPRVGQVLDLAADLENVDADSVEYTGTAHVDGRLLMRLQDCVGPMMRLADFDDPEALRKRFDELCRADAGPGSAPDLPQLMLERTGGDPGRHISATFQVPSEAPLFADHFPRRHVFPGSLLMHLNLQLGAAFASEIPPPPGSRWVAGMILDMKLRSFIPPGASLRFEARLKQRSNESASLALETRTNKETIATSGLLLKAGDIV